LAFYIRAASAALKFLFVFYLAKKADASLVGSYGLLSSTAAYFIVIAGLELNQVNGRVFHKKSKMGLQRMLGRQLRLHLLIYLVSAPVLFLAISTFTSKFYFHIFLILAMEHLTVELYRLNLLQMRPLKASVLLLCKNLWILFVITGCEAGLIDLTDRNIVTVWLAVLISTTLLFGREHVGAIEHCFSGMNQRSMRIDLILLKRALPFFVIAVAFSGAAFFDKLIIKFVVTEVEFATYYFFYSLASALSLFVSFTSGAVQLPKHIRIYSIEGERAYRAARGGLISDYVRKCGLGITLVGLGVLPVLFFMKNVDYLSNLHVFYTLLLAAAFIAASEPYRLDLYLKKEDRASMRVNIYYLIVTVIVVSCLAYGFGLTGAATAMLASSSLYFLIFRKCSRLVLDERSKIAAIWLFLIPFNKSLPTERDID